MLGVLVPQPRLSVQQPRLTVPAAHITSQNVCMADQHAKIASHNAQRSPDADLFRRMDSVTTSGFASINRDQETQREAGLPTGCTDMLDLSQAKASNAMGQAYELNYGIGHVPLRIRDAVSAGQLGVLTKDDLVILWEGEHGRIGPRSEYFAPKLDMEDQRLCSTGLLSHTLRSCIVCFCTCMMSQLAQQNGYGSDRTLLSSDKCQSMDATQQPHTQDFALHSERCIKFCPRVPKECCVDIICDQCASLPGSMIEPGSPMLPRIDSRMAGVK